MKFLAVLRGASEPGAKSDIAGEVERTGGVARQNEPEPLSIARPVIMKTFMTGVVKTRALGQPSGDLFDWPVLPLPASVGVLSAPGSQYPRGTLVFPQSPSGPVSIFCLYRTTKFSLDEGFVSLCGFRIVTCGF